MEVKVHIESVVDRGDIDHERLVLRAVRDADIGDFMLIRTRFEGDQVTTGVINTLWFPDQTVKTGDIIVVYSKSGGTTRKRTKDGRTAHFFYWGQKSALWESERFAPVLLHAPEWATKSPKDLATSEM